MNVDKILDRIKLIKQSQAQKYYENAERIIKNNIDFYYNKDFAKKFIKRK